MNQVATIDTVFTELMAASSNSRQRESLERVKKACDYLEEQELKISPSSIERYCIDPEIGKARRRNRFAIRERYFSVTFSLGSPAKN